MWGAQALLEVRRRFLVGSGRPSMRKGRETGGIYLRRRTLKSTLHPAIFWEMVKFVDLGVLYFSLVLATEPTMGSRERGWFVLERPRRDTNGGSETEVTVTSKLQANAERNKEIEKRQRREEKAASFGGAVRGSVPEDELSGGGVQDSEAESEGGRRPECPG